MGAIRKTAGGVPAQAGLAVLVAGTITIGNLYINSTSEIVLTRVIEQALGDGFPDHVAVTARVNGNGSGSFTITSHDVADSSTIQWCILSDLEGLT